MTVEGLNFEVVNKSESAASPRGVFDESEVLAKAQKATNIFLNGVKSGRGKNAKVEKYLGNSYDSVKTAPLMAKTMKIRKQGYVNKAGKEGTLLIAEFDAIRRDTGKTEHLIKTFNKNTFTRIYEGITLK